MKKTLSIAVLSVLYLQVNAQDASVKAMQTTAATTVQADTSKKANKKGWVKGGNFSLGITQIGNSNWMAASGDKFSLSGAVSLNAFANRKWGRNTWDNILDINYGLVNTSTLGMRKINDRIDLFSKYGYKPKKWSKAFYSVVGQLRTQLASGYQYDYLGTDSKRRISGFFAPAYFTIAPGIDWRPNDWFSLFGSPLATRWTIVSNGPYSYAAQGGIFNGKIETPLASLYGVNPATQNRGEFGTFITASIKKEVLKNVDYFSKFDFYFSYIRNNNNVTGRNQPDIFWTNQFRFKVNKFINVSYSLDMLYDDDVANPVKPGNPIGLQVLSTFGIGFATRF